jgi:hypothetical protein
MKHAPRPGKASIVSQFLFEEKQQGRKMGTKLASFWTTVEFQSEAAFFPQCVLNCGSPGMALW